MVRPQVSVIVPCFNYAQYLPEAIESLVQQTFQDFEVIVINDGSTDRTAKVAESLKETRSGLEILIINQQHNGVAVARNVGMAHARGQFILPLDADDKLHPAALEKMVRVLRGNPDVGIVYSWVQDFGDSEKLWKHQDYSFEALKNGGCFISCSSLFRKKAWEATGGYNPNMKRGWEDLEFWINCGKHGFHGKLIPEPLLFWRRHPGARTELTEDSLEDLMEQIREIHSDLYRFRRKITQQEAVRPGPQLVFSRKEARAEKVLLVLPGHGISTTDVATGYGDALACLGHEVLDFDLFERLRFFQGAAERLRKIRKEKKEDKLRVEMAIFNAATVEIPVAVLKELPDLIIYVTGQFVPRFPLELIRTRFPVPQVLILTETPYLAELEKRMLPFYDAVFANDKCCLEEYRRVNKNTFYLGTAFSTEIYPYKGPVEREFCSDLFFVGSPVPGRAEFLNEICEKLEGVDFKLFVIAGEKFGLHGRVFNFLRGRGLKQGEVAKYLAGAKIGFNLFRLNDQREGLGLEPYSLNPRVYEVMASGALLLTDYRPELEEMFEVGKDLVVFDGVEDFLEKVKYFLNHEEERQGIAKRGQNKVSKSHSYIDRAKQLLETVRNMRKESEVMIDGLQNR